MNAPGTDPTRELIELEDAVRHSRRMCQLIDELPIDTAPSWRAVQAVRLSAQELHVVLDRWAFEFAEGITANRDDAEISEEVAFAFLMEAPPFATNTKHGDYLRHRSGVSRFGNLRVTFPLLIFALVAFLLRLLS